MLTRDSRGRSGRLGGNRRGQNDGKAGGRRGKGTARFIEEEASRHGTVGEEGEELEAELPVGFDLRGKDRDDGDELGSLAAMEELGRREGARREGAGGGNGVRGKWGCEWGRPPWPRRHARKGARRHGRPDMAPVPGALWRRR